MYLLLNVFALTVVPAPARSSCSSLGVVMKSRRLQSKNIPLRDFFVSLRVYSANHLTSITIGFAIRICLEEENIRLTASTEVSS